MKKLKDLYQMSISNSPNNTFKALTVIDGAKREFVLTTRYREVCKYWTMDIADSDGVLLLSNIPLVSGINILEPFEYLGIGGIVFIDLYNSGKTAADASELGDSVKFVWGSLEDD